MTLGKENNTPTIINLKCKEKINYTKFEKDLNKWIKEHKSKTKK